MDFAFDGLATSGFCAERRTAQSRITQARITDKDRDWGADDQDAGRGIATKSTRFAQRLEQTGQQSKTTC